MNTVLFPGSFDPFTNGHLDIVKRAAKLFDQVVIAVGTNRSKKYLFTPEEKMALIEQSIKAAGIQNASVVALSGLTIDFVKEIGAVAIVRGLRNETDYLYERDIAEMNGKLGQVETVFLMARPENQNISSTILKEVASFGADVSTLVPEVVSKAIQQKFAH
ncbi:pantetheine-phosphate adenylyltransferase [Weissella diestrammenae]|uniref:Phosphopantetheine adenylyltransferase n=1 Tax=Weissella diestrammenae TaxID=1162633 RepID=A0A7G9T5E4_9LACO|nr:pantetheine-phosphate adenylyltransferase [Weissella diestrammenae]MCM0583178.1 pantetheine-phosphate adenylyltransferase [Weissella diestrammenae]QNN75319.1 pantetheine-phosphate adenylyltransferase [Weissella diestrammenae]